VQAEDRQRQDQEDDADRGQGREGRPGQAGARRSPGRQVDPVAPGPGLDLAVDRLHPLGVLGSALGHHLAAPPEGRDKEGHDEQQRQHGEEEADPAGQALFELPLERPGQGNQENRKSDGHGRHGAPLEERDHQDDRDDRL
jgi:hypothetical protein